MGWGALVDLGPPNEAPIPQIEIWNTINQWSFIKFSECQAPLHKRKVPLLKTIWRRFCAWSWSRCQAKFLTFVKFLTESGISRDVSCEISDFCEFSDLSLYVSCFASQSKRINFGDYFCDICCVNKKFWLDVR